MGVDNFGIEQLCITAYNRFCINGERTMKSTVPTSLRKTRMAERNARLVYEADGPYRKPGLIGSQGWIVKIGLVLFVLALMFLVARGAQNLRWERECRFAAEQAADPIDCGAVFR